MIGGIGTNTTSSATIAGPAEASRWRFQYSLLIVSIRDGPLLASPPVSSKASAEGLGPRNVPSLTGTRDVHHHHVALASEATWGWWLSWGGGYSSHPGLTTIPGWTQKQGPPCGCESLSFRRPQSPSATPLAGHNFPTGESRRPPTSGHRTSDSGIATAPIRWMP